MDDDMGGMAGFDWKTARYEAAEQELKRLTAEVSELRKDAERYRKLVACGKYAADSIGGGWGLAHSGVHTGRSSKAELDAAADALPAVG